MRAARLEFDTRASDEILHRARDEHLRRPRQRRDPGADVDRQACDVVANHLDFAVVHAAAHLDS